MSEWWTYRLSDFVMFSGPTWYGLLELHNGDWFPIHALTLLVAVTLVWSVFSKEAGAARNALVLCGLAWFFVGWAFHWERYSPINWGARYFAVAFGLQALLLVGMGLAGRHLRLAWDGLAGRLGALMLLLALLYPLLAPALGRPFTQSEWLGLMPAPTVLATLGLLLCLRPDGGLRHRRRSGVLLMASMTLPLLWCAVAGATLESLQAPEWFLLPLAGVAAAVAGWRKQPALQ